MAEAQDDGAIYVGVKPDFRGFEETLREQARRSGRKFGQEFAEDAEKTLTPDLVRGVGKASEKASRSAKAVQLKTDLRTEEAQAKLRQFTAQRAQVTAKVEADTKAAQVAIDRLTRQQASVQADVKLDEAEAQAKIDALEARKVEIQAKVDADTRAAEAKLVELDRKQIEIHAKVEVDDSGSRRAEGSLRDLGSAAADVVRPLTGLGVALAGIGPAALPSLAAATAGVVALGAAVGGAAVAAAGTGILAFSGLGDAVKALNDQESGAARTAAQAANASTQLAQQHLAAAGATDQLKAAQEGLKNAQAGAAEATRQAAQRVVDAEDDLRTAQQRARDAQLSLTEARKEAAQQLEDLNDRLKDNALSEEEAALRVQEARERLNKVRADPKATELERKEADLALRRAQLNAEQQTKDTKRLREEKAAADKAGVDGSKQVLNAQRGIADANKGVAEAERKIAEARRGQVETERRNAQQIATAKRSIVSANRAIEASALSMQKVAVPAIDKVAEAFRGKSKAFKDFALFLSGLGPGIDSLAAAGQKELFPKLEDAIRNLSPLMPILKRGIADVASAMGDAAIEISKALVSPEGRTFLKQILKDAPETIRSLGTLAATAAKAMASIFTAAGPAGKELLASVITNLNDFFKRISTPEGKKSLADFFSRGLDIVKSLGTLLGSFGNLLGAFVGAGDPNDTNSVAGSIRSIADMIDRLADSIRNNPDSIKWIKGIATAFAGLAVVGTIAGPIANIVKLFGALGSVLGIGGGAAVAGEAGAAGAAAGASGGIAGALGGVGAALAAIAGPVLIVVAVLAALAAAFYFAYTRSDTFRRIVNKSIDAVGKFFKSAWEDVLRPTFNFLGAAFLFLYNNVVDPTMKSISLAIDIAWKAIQITFGLWQIGMTLLGEAVKYLYDHYVAPIFDYIGKKIGDVWTGVVKPVFEAFGDFLKVHVIPKLQDAASVIGGIFNGVHDAWLRAMQGVVGLVNKVIHVYNDIAGKFHVGIHVDDVTNPFASQAAKPSNKQIVASQLGAFGHAAGGFITGPGTGTSDDIPVFLSNGEYVLRAAAVQSLGLPFLELLNRADKLGERGGDPSRTVLGVPRYAGGGLIEQAQSFIRAQDPKPYVWGAVGPNAYDCSGLVGAVMALLTGRNPYHRYMTTSSSMSALGFKPGHGAFTIGLDPGTHVVGNLAGLAFEAANPRAGIRVGSGAQSVDRLPQQWYLPQLPGGFVSAGGGGGSGGGFDILSLAKTAFDKVIGKVSSFVGDYLPGGGPFASLGQGVAQKVIDDVLPFDSGGVLPPGNTLAVNKTGKPEAILTANQWAAVEKSTRGGTNISIMYPPSVPPEQALVDAQARVDLLSSF